MFAKHTTSYSERTTPRRKNKNMEDYSVSITVGNTSVSVTAPEGMSVAEAILKASKAVNIDEADIFLSSGGQAPRALTPQQARDTKAQNGDRVSATAKYENG